MPDLNETRHERDTNPDPITGAPGSHPVGTGVGAAGGAAAGAALGAVAGPVGAAVGVVIGAVAGGLAGKGVAEAVDPTAEDAYWREHHGSQPFAGRDRSYEDYAPAYRTGYESFGHFEPGTRFEDAEPRLREYYETRLRDQPMNTTAIMSGVRGGSETGPLTVEQAGGDPTARAGSGATGMPGGSGGKPGLGWDEARHATRAAWERVSHGATRGPGAAPGAPPAM